MVSGAAHGPIEFYRWRARFITRLLRECGKCHLRRHFALRGGGPKCYPLEPPAANNRGWKDTIEADPGYVTQVIAHFGKFKGLFKDFTGKYVWHCHILEHEDHDMMRPYEVLPREDSDGLFPNPLVAKKNRQALFKIGPPQNLDSDDLYEDVNGDDEFDIEDAIALGQVAWAYENGYLELSDEQVAALDANGDGELTTQDAIALGRMALFG